MANRLFWNQRHFNGVLKMNNKSAYSTISIVIVMILSFNSLYGKSTLEKWISSTSSFQCFDKSSETLFSKQFEKNTFDHDYDN